MVENINLELRTEVLEFALGIEFQINQLILAYLGIEKESTKAFSNKSSSLSFKNKIDLLFDIDVLSKEEHSELELLMIFRNQFLHNLNCNSFVFAVACFENSFKNRLLKFDTAQIECSDEFRYADSYRLLHLKCLQIIVEKYQAKMGLIEEKRQLLKEPVEHTIFFIDTLFDFFKELFEKHMLNESDSEEIIAFKANLFEIIKIKSDSISSSERYIFLKEQREKSMKEDKIKKFLK